MAAVSTVVLAAALSLGKRWNPCHVPKRTGPTLRAVGRAGPSQTANTARSAAKYHRGVPASPPHHHYLHRTDSAYLVPGDDNT